MSHQPAFEAYPEMNAGEYYPLRMPHSAVSSLERLRIRIFGAIKAGTDTLHFSGATDIYLFKCRDCGQYNCDYLHGFFPNQRLDCRACEEKEKREGN